MLQTLLLGAACAGGSCRGWGPAQSPGSHGPSGFSSGLKPHSQNVPVLVFFLVLGNSSFWFSFPSRVLGSLLPLECPPDRFFSGSLSGNVVCRHLLILACLHSLSLHQGAQRAPLPSWKGMKENGKKRIRMLIKHLATNKNPK